MKTIAKILFLLLNMFVLIEWMAINFDNTGMVSEWIPLTAIGIMYGQVMILIK
jgi:hypothetical protein